MGFRVRVQGELSAKETESAAKLRPSVHVGLGSFKGRSRVGIVSLKRFT